ncbi:MAG TPA: OmpA family protein [Puia sp.]|nr:OmpA family protein [Puia sp.]
MWRLVRCLILLLALAPAANGQRKHADSLRGHAPGGDSLRAGSGHISLYADTLVARFAFDRSIVRPADSAALVQLVRQPAQISARPAQSSVPPAQASAKSGQDSVPRVQISARPGQSPGKAGHPADSILVIGHADTTGSNTYNQRLSLRRALAIKNILTLAQVVPVRLEARGESEPLPGDDSLSRRVEIIVYYHGIDTPVIAAAPHIDSPKALPDDEPDTTFGLDNINFIANTPTLTDASREALPLSIPYLRSLSIDRYLEIDGFCNSPGPLLPKTDVLFVLSIKRAKYIYEYLIAQGFDSTHLSYRGMGNASPINAHPTTAAEMDKNMRVEIRVFRKPPPQH